MEPFTALDKWTGQTRGLTLDSMQTKLGKALVFISGLMVAVIVVTGRTENKMVWQTTRQLLTMD
jgi:hypothetical protein